MADRPGKNINHKSLPKLTTHMATWKDLEQCLQTGMTIGQAERTPLEGDKEVVERGLHHTISCLVEIFPSEVH